MNYAFYAALLSCSCLTAQALADDHFPAPPDMASPVTETTTTSTTVTKQLPDSDPAPMAPAVTTAVSAPPPAAMPAPAVETRTPYVILRFNQQQLDLKEALSNAVSSAQAMKQDVGFDCILHRANGGTQGDQNLLKVTSAMRELGVSANRIATRDGPASTSAYDEVYIYVR